MSQEHDVRRIADALNNIAHAFTRLSNAQQRIAAAMEETNKQAAQHD